MSEPGYCVELLEAAKAHISARSDLEGTPVFRLRADDPRFKAVEDTLLALKDAIAKATGAQK